jgi:hypothetical protein
MPRAGETAFRWRHRDRVPPRLRVLLFLAPHSRRRSADAVQSTGRAESFAGETTFLLQSRRGEVFPTNPHSTDFNLRFALRYLHRTRLSLAAFVADSPLRPAG